MSSAVVRNSLYSLQGMMLSYGFHFLLLWQCLISICLSHPFQTAKADVVDFTIDLIHENIDPIGAGHRRAILVNGSFPGPPLFLQAGQKVKLVVKNRLQNETAVHFHGIGQQKTPWADGTPGVSQYPIKPGETYLYEWYADEPGVFFYHAHDRGQIMDGLYGAIVVAADNEAERPFDLLSSDPIERAAMRKAENKIQPLLISDWTQFTFEEFNHVQSQAHIDFTCMDSVVINGVVCTVSIKSLRMAYLAIGFPILSTSSRT